MAEISMEQNVNITTLLLGLGVGSRVTVRNLGAVQITNDRLQFLQKPTEFTFTMGQADRQALLDDRRRQGCKRQIASAHMNKTRGKKNV
jgi:hypothetical protein